MCSMKRGLKVKLIVAGIFTICSFSSMKRGLKVLFDLLDKFVEFENSMKRGLKDEFVSQFGEHICEGAR